MQEELDLQALGTRDKNVGSRCYIDVTASSEDMVKSIEKICMEQGLSCFMLSGSVQVEWPSQKSRETRLLRAMKELKAEFTLPLFKE